MAIGRRTVTPVVDIRGVDNLTLTVPSGSTTGDMMYAVFGTIAFAPTTINTPSGWTKVGERHTAGTDNTTSWLFRKPAGGSEPASYTWTYGNNGKAVGQIITYTGVDLTAATQFEVAGWVDPPTQIAGPSININSGDWMLTYGMARQSPSTNVAKTWTNATSTDLELADAWTNDTAAARHATNAAWDTNGPAVTAGDQARTVTVNPRLQQVHLWAIRIPALTTGGGGGGTGWSLGMIPIR